MNLRYGLLLAFFLPLLGGCEQLGIEDPAVEKAREEAEGKAIGSGCRQTGRALEDCYQANRKASKAAIFTGWREMDAYMRENKIEEIRPDSAVKPPSGKASAPESTAEGDEAAPQKQAKAAEAADAKPVANAAKPVAAAKPGTEAKPAESAPVRKPRPALAH